MNPLKGKLGLLDDDVKREEKLHRLAQDLGSKVLVPLGSQLDWRYSEADMTAAEALGADWRQWAAFGPRQVWSKKQGNTWFAAEVTVPEAARGRTLVIRITSQWQNRPGSTDPQCLAYLDGETLQAVDGNHTEIVIARNAVPGETHELRINAFTFFDRPLVGFPADYMIRHERVEKLYYDVLTPLEVAERLPQNDQRRHAVLNLVEQALRSVDRRGIPDEASLAAAEKVAAEIYQLTDFEQQPLISAVGHTHLDVGWLWRVLQVRDKTGRSFATVLKLMEEYPDFVFMYNQSVLYNFLKTDYPELWEGLKAKVKSGQWEIEGAMWVEPDVNIVSGESLVRQIMRGRQFHIDEFGVTPKSVWLPDTFGYSANLPQIMERSGLEYFITSKLSWNDTDRHPYDTFFWKGIDGTTTKAQLITAQAFESERIFTTYNSDLSVSEVMGAWKRYEPKSVNDEVIVCYGFGDGGGGPTRAMIERGRRLEQGIPGAPRVKLEGLSPFLERLGARMDADAARFPVWNGELYLQYHRGTLTNVAKNKRNNRIAERRLRELELVASLASLAGHPYPRAELQAFWDMVLVNQFHDILPGTSIEEVYVDSDAEYAELFSTLDSGNGPLQAAASAALAPATGELRLLNTLSHPRSGLVALPGATAGALSVGGALVPVQQLVSPSGETVAAAPVESLPALGWVSAAMSTAPAAAPSSLEVSPTRLENALIAVTFDARGEITSLRDKASGRELVQPGQTANRLIAYEDKPLNWDAWDIDAYFDEQSWSLADGSVKVEVVETGPWRAALRIERAYQSSTFVQVVSLEAGARQVEFDTWFDWRERQQVVKAVFPFDLNVAEVRSEIQFGHVKRATHRNTSWDRARFEASMHRWVDISEFDFGAALLNDCKYGYDAVEAMLRLTLVRGATHPYAEADIGEHRVRYAVLVHGGVADLEQVHLAAERFNNPVLVIGDATQTGEAGSQRFSLAGIDSDCVTIETVKAAQDGKGLILRLFEHANRRVPVKLSFGPAMASVSQVNLMEEGDEPLALSDNSVSLELRPFEIATLRVIPA